MKPWRWWLEPREWVGIDRGATAIKLAVVASRPGGYLVRETQLEPAHRDPFLAGDPPARRREGWPEAAAVVLERDDALFRSLCVVGIRPREAPRALYLELERVLGRPPDDLALDYLEASAEGRSSQETCYVVFGAPEAAVREAAESLRNSGWRRLAVEPHASVLWRLWRLTGKNEGAARGTIDLMVDLGATRTRILVVVDGLPALYRSVAVGGEDFTAVLTGGTGGNGAKAEADKLTFYQNGPMEVFLEPLRALLGELGRTIRHFERQHPGLATRLLACGGGALWPALLETLAENLDAEVKPVLLAAGDGTHVNPRFAVSAAAAVRRLPEEGSRPPLRPAGGEGEHAGSRR